jgi:uncharacterized protein YycO
MFRNIIVRKFPPNYPWYKKSMANLIHITGNIPIHRRENLLTSTDRKNLERVLKKGDILTVGNLRKLYSFVLRNPVTHAILYAGDDSYIHVIGHGVQYTNLDYIFDTYDTLAVFRMPERSEKIISSVIAYSEDQIGKPYNFGFKDSSETYFCSQLINDAYLASGHNTGLRTRDGNRIKIPLCPADFLQGNFSLVATSENLHYENGALHLKQ